MHDSAQARLMVKRVIESTTTTASSNGAYDLFLYTILFTHWK